MPESVVTAGLSPGRPGPGASRASALQAGSQRSHDGTFDDIPGRHPGKMAMTRQSALDIVARAAFSQADQCRILALPYPVEYRVFWQVLADLGVTKERLMNRMGASP